MSADRHCKLFFKVVGLLNPDTHANYETINKYMHTASNSLFGAG